MVVDVGRFSGFRFAGFTSPFRGLKPCKTMVKWTRLVLILFLVRILNPEWTCKTDKPANRQPEKQPTFTTITLQTIEGIICLLADRERTASLNNSCKSTFHQSQLPLTARALRQMPPWQVHLNNLAGPSKQFGNLVPKIRQLT